MKTKFVYGFYGCAGRLVKVSASVRTGPGKKPPKTVELDCPACGKTHKATVIWRGPKGSTRNYHLKNGPESDPDLELGRI